METIQLYRGINKEERDLWLNSEYSKLKDVIWFSNETDAKLYAKHSVLKVTVKLNPEYCNHYENGGRGNLKDYTGYGIHYNKRYYSFSKKYLLENIESVGFSRNMIPEFIDNYDLSELEKKDEVFFTVHTLDLIKLEKTDMQFEVLKGNQLSGRITDDMKCALLTEDSINFYKLKP